MKYRIYLIGIALLLLLAAGMFAVLKPGTQAPSLTDQSKSEKSVASATVADKPGAMIPAKESKSNDRKRPELKYPDLVSKYGESRVNLSRHITSERVAMFNDMIEVGGAAGIDKLVHPDDESKDDSESKVTAQLGTVSASLNLSAEQITKIANLLAKSKQRKLTAIQDVVNQTSKDPTAMMTALLVSDAAARREIDEPEFKRLTSEAERLVSDQSGKVNIDMDVGNNPFTDEVFVSELKVLLGPNQRTAVENEMKGMTSSDKLEALKAARSKYTNQQHLEEVDTNTSSAKKMMAGLKSMIEGVKSMRKSINNPSAGN